MTISRKLLMTALLAGISTIGFAGESNGEEANQILRFTQTLRQTDDKNSLKLAQWLEHTALNESNHAVTNSEIVILSKIINDNELTVETKISLLSQLMIKQKSEQRKATAYNIARRALTLTASVAAIYIAYKFGTELFKNKAIPNKSAQLDLNLKTKLFEILEIPTESPSFFTKYCPSWLKID